MDSFNRCSESGKSSMGAPLEYSQLDPHPLSPMTSSSELTYKDPNRPTETERSLIPVSPMSWGATDTYHHIDSLFLARNKTQQSTRREASDAHLEIQSCSESPSKGDELPLENEDAEVGPSLRSIRSARQYRILTRLEVIRARDIRALLYFSHWLLLLAILDILVFIILVNTAYQYGLPEAYDIYWLVCDSVFMLMLLVLLCVLSCALYKLPRGTTTHEQFWILFFMISLMLYLIPYETIVNHLLEESQYNGGNQFFYFIRIALLWRSMSFQAATMFYLASMAKSFGVLSCHLPSSFYMVTLSLLFVVCCAQQLIFWLQGAQVSEIPLNSLIILIYSTLSLDQPWNYNLVISVTIYSFLQLCLLIQIFFFGYQTKKTLAKADYMETRTKQIGYRFFRYFSNLFFGLFWIACTALIFAIPSDLFSGYGTGMAYNYKTQVYPPGVYLILVVYALTETILKFPANLNSDGAQQARWWQRRNTGSADTKRPKKNPTSSISCWRLRLRSCLGLDPGSGHENGAENDINDAANAAAETTTLERIADENEQGIYETGANDALSFSASSLRSSSSNLVRPILYRSRERKEIVTWSITSSDTAVASYMVPNLLHIRDNLFVMQTHVLMFNFSWYVYHYGTRKQDKVLVNEQRYSQRESKSKSNSQYSQVVLGSGLNANRSADLEEVITKQDSVCASQQSVDGKPMITVSGTTFEVISYISDDATDTHVLIVRMSDRIVLSFRGTSSLTNVLTDLNIRTVRVKELFGSSNDKSLKSSGSSLVVGAELGATADPIARAGEEEETKSGVTKPSSSHRARVHAGFAQAYNSVRRRIVMDVKRLFRDKHRKIYLTGHSLGSCLATLCALDLRMTLGIPSRYLAVSTFGSPRCGNRSFAQMYDEVVPNHWRTEVQNDPITNMPRWGYKHVGKKAMFLLHGELFLDPNLLEFHTTMCMAGSQTLSLQHHRKPSYLSAIRLWCDKQNAAIDSSPEYHHHHHHHHAAAASTQYHPEFWRWEDTSTDADSFDACAGTDRAPNLEPNPC